MDPRFAEFNASVDHFATTPEGQPAVSRYDLEFYLVGAQQPFQTAALGKPAPDSTGLIRIDLAAALVAFPPPVTVYEARVSAIGPGGVGRSDVSNQFAFSAVCSVAIGSTSASVPATTTTGSVSVTAATGCGWTATSNAAWLSITSGGSGSGSETVTYSVAANPSTSSRSGTLTIAGLTFTVTQAGLPCTYALSPGSASVAAGASTGSFSVSSLAGCPWSASESAAWLTITAGATGSGNGTVTYSVAANATASSRTATISVAAQTFTVMQAAASSCNYDVNPTVSTVSNAGGTVSIAVATGSNCSWTASSYTSWVTVASGQSGQGTGSVTMQVAPNPTPYRRATTVYVANRSVTINQELVTLQPPGNLRIVR